MACITLLCAHPVMNTSKFACFECVPKTEKISFSLPKYNFCWEVWLDSMWNRTAREGKKQRIALLSTKSKLSCAKNKWRCLLLSLDVVSKKKEKGNVGLLWRHKCPSRIWKIQKILIIRWCLISPQYLLKSNKWRWRD